MKERNITNKYYCHSCANKLSLIPDPPRDKIVKTQYQYKKHMKHTIPDSTYPIQSIFSHPSTAVYADHLVNTMLNGAVEIDNYGRTNIIWCAGKKTGFRYRSGQLVQPSDAVKVVLSTSTSSVHAFPENSTSFNKETCQHCGNLIVY